jgi:type I restriction enzyme R subunit
LGYLMRLAKERFKDESIDIAGAGEKVKKLINEHLIDLGINPKIPPLELFSPSFLPSLESNETPQTKASEMEHAIRKHCTIHHDEDPSFYQALSEKLETLIR